ncbi:MAG: twin-arginine translocase TatA/TatE family subunit [Alphaproteobacteria bacterium]|nr:twin-arginine translocase TatA/TatE family subunit [Alphaproteobacteria bacterium]
MGSLSIWHWIIILLVVVVLFGGGGKLSGIMGDLGAGLKNFKKNLRDEEDKKK